MLRKKIRKKEGDKPDLDFYRNFSFNVSHLTGINETVAPFAIKDEELITSWNFLPTATGTLRKIKAPKKVFSTSSPIVRMVSHILNDIDVYLLFLQNGSVLYKIGNSQYNVIASEGTLSGNPATFDVAIWQNHTIYIVDVVNGYFKFYYDTNQKKWKFIQIDSELKGHTILIWQGRVFIGNKSIIQYSRALEPEDFTGTGSGYIDLAQSFPVLKLYVKKLISYIDNLFVLGDNAILALTGTTTTNDPSQWYLTQISNDLGVENHNLVCSFNNEYWLQNEKGIFKGIPTSLKKFDYKIKFDELQFLNRQTSIVQINNLTFYPILIRKNSPIRKGIGDVILFYADDINEFYYVDLGFNVYGVYWSLLPNVENQIYILGDNGLYQWEGSYDYIKCLLQTKFFNLNNDTIEKVWQYVYFSITIYPSYNIVFNVYLKTERELSTMLSYLIDPPISGEMPIIFGFVYENLPVINFTYQNFSPFSVFFPIQALGNKIHTICSFYFKAIGRYCSIILEEEGNNPFEISYISILGQIGRKVI